MSPEYWEQIKVIFAAAIELPPDVREEFVRQKAGGNQLVSDEVLSLLHEDSDETDFRNPLFNPSSPVTAIVPEGGFEELSPTEVISWFDSPPEDRSASLPVAVEGRIGSYRLLERIGQGGMGVVYCARDERRDRLVALKTLKRTNAPTLHRFKQEFRSFAGLSHPNLVKLYELISDGTHWCFTMELVNGKPFLEYVTGTGLPAAAESDGGPTEQERLRGALRQLASGVAALHANGKLHRDLKPSNVLVTPEHRVVVLDFGLGAELDAIGVHETTDDHVFGSVVYMSPEQAMGGPLSAGSDWYSVGVILYYALTGRPPFDGTLLEILRAKETREPDPPVAVVPSAPGDLNQLCMELLRRNPADRPGGAEVLARLGTGPEIAKKARRHGDAPFVGRRQELAALRDAYRSMRLGRPVVAYVEGQSGAGKTALVHRFLEEIASESEAVVLAGRCHEQEFVPFKALDSLIDAIAQFLRRLSPLDLSYVTPRDIRALARVFPVLCRIPGFANAPPAGGAEPDPLELRRRAGGALRELLARLGAKYPVILFVDDLHWGDSDSASLLTDILTPPDPPVFLGIACYRSEDVSASPFFNTLEENRRRTPPKYDERHVLVGQLAQDETKELTHRIVPEGDQQAAALVDEIVRESAGRPFLVYELIEHVKASAEGVRLEEPLALNTVLWRRIETLPEESRRLLEVVAIAGRPIEAADAFAAAGLKTDEWVILPVLKSERLVRSTPAGSGQCIEVFHDRVRQTVLEHLSAGSLAEHHRRLASVYAESGHADADVMAHHLDRGGQPEAAAEHYALAAGKAVASLAFEHAALLYRQALALKQWSVEKERTLRTQLADALSNAGRGADAAEEYLRTASGATHDAALDLQHRAALALLTSGHVDRGLSCLDPVMKSAGTRLAAAPWRALLSLLVHRVRLSFRGTKFVERRENSVDPDTLRRIDIGWSVVIGLSVIDPIRGADFQTRSLLLALRAGEPFRVARALALEAGHLASSGSGAKARKTLAEADRLAASLDRPYTNGMVELARGTLAYFDERWQESLRCCTKAAGTFREHCTGATWEIDTANAFALWSITKMGGVGELSRICPALLKEAHERGDLYAIANLSTQIMALVRLAADDPEGARQELHQVMGTWSQKGYHVQHHDALLAFVPIELYTGNPEEAWTRVQAEWGAFRWSLLSHIQDLRIEMLQLRAYCALAMAASTSPRRRHLAVAARDAKRLRGEKMPWTSGLANYISGAVASLEGDRTKARARLRAAIADFDGVNAHLYAAAARWRLSQISNAGEASEPREAAEGWFRSNGIKVPERMVDAFAPGFAVR
jgi:tRNA A-37 threonylcarbamoyl transferase component Bud32